MVIVRWENVVLFLSMVVVSCRLSVVVVLDLSVRSMRMLCISGWSTSGLPNVVRCCVWWIVFTRVWCMVVEEFRM